jgi:hypothetical protein
MAVRVGFEYYWTETGTARGVQDSVVHTRRAFISRCVHNPDGFGIREDFKIVLLLIGRMARREERIVYRVRERAVPVEYTQRVH